MFLRLSPALCLCFCFSHTSSTTFASALLLLLPTPVTTLLFCSSSAATLLLLLPMFPLFLLPSLLLLLQLRYNFFLCFASSSAFIASTSFAFCFISRCCVNFYSFCFCFCKQRTKCPTKTATHCETHLLASKGRNLLLSCPWCIVCYWSFSTIAAAEVEAFYTSWCQISPYYCWDYLSLS